MVSIPNKKVVENSIKNFTRTEQSRVILNCGIGYESDLEFVRKLAVETITANFEVRYWINSTSGLEVAKSKTEAIIVLKKTFDENNINIPFPIRTLNIPNLKFGDQELSKTE